MAPIHAAAQAGNQPCLEYLVKGANVSVRSRADDGATPAHFAAASGQVRVLIRLGRGREGGMVDVHILQLLCIIDWPGGHVTFFQGGGACGDSGCAHFAASCYE